LIDLRHIVNDIYFFQNRIQYSTSSTIATLNIDKGVTLPSFSLSQTNRHPFIDALQTLSSEDLGHDSALELLKSEMKKFYTEFQPANAFEILGLDEEKSHTLETFEPYALTLPWDNAGPVKERKAKMRSIREENAVLNVDAGEDAGWAWSGPVSDEKLEVEARRLMNVYRSIQEQGYCRSDEPDGDIRVNLLFDESYNHATWQARVGQHRAIALAALGYEEITCRISKVIVKSEVEKWHNVRNGLYDEQLAIAVFDRIFLLGQKEAYNKNV